MSLQDAVKLLENEISDPDMLLAAKEQLARDIAADPTVLKDKSWLENIIKGNRYEAATFAAYETEGELLRNFEKQVGVAEGYLAKQNGFNHLQQVQIYIGNSYFIADDMWIKRVVDIDGKIKYECYISESKLNEGTNLSTMQGKFSEALKTQKDFNIRTLEKGPLRQNNVIEVRGAKRINGPDVNNSTFTEFKNKK